MDVREKLIEILKTKYDHFCDQCGINKDSRYIENLASYLIANGVTVQEWISVDERLPEEKANCIVYYKHAFCDDENHVGICVCFYDCNEFDMDFAHKVTHWMPLPEPPKGE